MKPRLTLASQSLSRQKMLKNAGYNFDIYPADLDEEKIIEEKFPYTSPENISLILAQEKAKKISTIKTENYIIGSDQVLFFNNEIFSKAKDKDEAIEKLKILQGKEHRLISSVSVYKNNVELFSVTDSATLKIKDLTHEQIVNYVDKAGDVITSCVGFYALETLGIRLFEKIQGNHFTILGMPLLPLSLFLDKQGFEL